MSKFTRRELAAALSTSAVLLGRPQVQPAPATPDEERKAWLAQLRDSANQLDQFSLPMTAEPATIFKP